MKRAAVALAFVQGVAFAQPAATSNPHSLDFAEFGTATIDLPAGWDVGDPRIERVPLTALITYPTVDGRDDHLPLIMLFYIPPERRAQAAERTEQVVGFVAESMAKIGAYEPPQEVNANGTRYWTLRGVDDARYAEGRPDVFKLHFYRDGATVEGTLRMRKRDAKLEASFRDALLGIRLKMADSAPTPNHRVASPGIIRVLARVPDLQSKSIAAERMAGFGEPTEQWACGIQASVLFKSPDVYDAILGRAAETLQRSVRRDGRTHSVLYIRFEKTLSDEAGALLSGLLYGADGQPSAMHPEIAMLFDDAIAIVCDGSNSPLLREAINQALR